jgi:glucose-1-phosphate thymidylyltransferase
VQPKPEGLAQAFIIAKEFIGGSGACLVLGDNIFYGDGLQEILRRAVSMERGGLVFGYWVRNPERYGVVEFDGEGKVVSIVEKPKEPVSNYALPGLYFFDSSVSEIASSLKPSARGELEIVDVMSAYLKRGELRVELLGRGYAWLDTGTPESLLEACMFIQTIEKRQGLKIACVEEIAYRMGYIDAAKVRSVAEGLRNNDYGKYLLQVIDGSRF